MELTLNGKPAVKINAELVKPWHKTSLYDCEGDEIWVPHSLSSYNSEEKTLTVEEWFYNKMVNAGKL